MNMRTAVLPTSPPRFDSRRASAARTGRLVFAALIVTGVAALLAWVLASVLHLSEQAVVLSVMTIAFAASWAVTNRRPVNRHRVALIPARVRTH
jgi:FtsH-binding integral membrane protein